MSYTESMEEKRLVYKLGGHGTRCSEGIWKPGGNPPTQESRLCTWWAAVLEQGGEGSAQPSPLRGKGDTHGGTGLGQCESSEKKKGHRNIGTFQSFLL